MNCLRKNNKDGHCCLQSNAAFFSVQFYYFIPLLLYTYPFFTDVTGGVMTFGAEIFFFIKYIRVHCTGQSRVVGSILSIIHPAF